MSYEEVQRVPESEVRAVPAPAFTKSWRPYSHAQVMDCMLAACKTLDLEVKPKGREYSLSKTGERLFAAWNIENRSFDEGKFMLGWRNAINKQFAIGICAGERITVCSNMVFAGQFVLFRKHTGQLELGEITVLAVEAMKQVVAQFDGIRQWHESLKKVGLTSAQASLITSAAMRQELLKPQWYPKFHELYYESDRYSPTLHGWHGTMTELLRDLSLHTVHFRSGLLNRFIDHEVPELLKVADKPRPAFIDITSKAIDVGAKERAEKKVVAQKTSKEIKQAYREKVKAEKRAAKPKKEAKPKKAKAKKVTKRRTEKKASPKKKPRAKRATKKAKPEVKAEPKTKVIKKSNPMKEAHLLRCPYCHSITDSTKSQCQQCGKDI